MTHNIKSIRPFIGAKDFEISRSFYRDLGFEEGVLESNFSVFKSGEFAFYLQDYYDKSWIENTMVFLEVDDAVRYYNELLALNLTEKYDVKLTPTRHLDWGSECFLHDPAGILWHFGTFKK
ncbi:VOC family protein [Flavobacterium daemonense]|uniref:VOC family protein n=1 Tax=Flavobacterium daemonense TaxID=1393049 RepID=UPI00118487BE|nr:VOC family protein [Flavobacterium daemonense]KAF2333801.1 glyoxalase [Flavobacterium daemonense]